MPLISKTSRLLHVIAGCFERTQRCPRCHSVVTVRRCRCVAFSLPAPSAPPIPFPPLLPAGPVLEQIAVHRIIPILLLPLESPNPPLSTCHPLVLLLRSGADYSEKRSHYLLCHVRWKGKKVKKGILTKEHKPFWLVHWRRPGYASSNRRRPLPLRRLTRKNETNEKG